MNENVFIAGSREISRLDPAVAQRIQNVCEKGLTVLVGDAKGVDKAAQLLLHEANYDKVIVFVSGGMVRNNVGNWRVEAIDAGKKKGFALYQQKDLAMAEQADYGFMVWDGISKGTAHNMAELAKASKKCATYYTPLKRFFTIEGTEQLKRFAGKLPEPSKGLLLSLLEPNKSEKQRQAAQITLSGFSPNSP